MPRLTAGCEIGNTLGMARIRIELPPKFLFKTEIPVRITDLNYGAHLGNDSFLSLLHEARVRFLQHHGFTELNIDGCGLIMVDAAIAYRNQVRYGDTLSIEVGLLDPQRSGCDFVYRVTKTGTDEVAAEAKTGVVFFNYQTQKVQRMPEKFATLFPQSHP